MEAANWMKEGMCQGYIFAKYKSNVKSARGNILKKTDEKNALGMKVKETQANSLNEQQPHKLR